jgi:hypothetical protein
VGFGIIVVQRACGICKGCAALLCGWYETSGQNWSSALQLGVITFGAVPAVFALVSAAYRWIMKFRLTLERENRLRWGAEV